MDSQTPTPSPTPIAVLRGLIESTPDAIVVVGLDGKIVLVNGPAERMFQYARSELVGQPIEVLVPNRLRETDPDRRARGLRRDGTEVPIDIRLHHLTTDEGVMVASVIRDVTEQRKADELRAELAAIVDSSSDAILSRDFDGVIRSWNKGAEILFGYTAHEVIGKNISLLVPEGRHDEGPEIVSRLRRGEVVETVETVRHRKDGQEIHVSVTHSPLRDSRGRIVGASKVARDISDRKRAEADLAKAREATELANKELEALSYSIAHDLRAPLRGIDGFSQALLDEHAPQLDESGQRYLRRVRESAQQMARLIDGLLAITRISRGDMRCERVDLGALARAAAERLKATQPEREVDVSIGTQLETVGDSRSLGIVVDSLLGNAWKFTREQPKASIQFDVVEQDGERVFVLRDNGAGFDMAFAAKLFGVFQRLHTVDEFEGTGVGLAMVERIIRRHNGQIWAEGKVGGGATFYFTVSEQERNG